MIEIIGWIGSILFAICAIPQAYHCWKTKSCHGMTWLFLLMWLFGEVFTIIYVVLQHFSWALIFNYVFNLLSLGVIIYYKLNTKQEGV